jgi:hypothetical protein
MKRTIWETQFCKLSTDGCPVSKMHTYRVNTVWTVCVYALLPSWRDDNLKPIMEFMLSCSRNVYIGVPKTQARGRMHKTVFIGYSAHKIDVYDPGLSFSSGSMWRFKVLQKGGIQHAYNTVTTSISPCQHLASHGENRSGSGRQRN